MKLLIHTCCAPCLTYTADYFGSQEEVDTITAFWFNPNIHPFKEYERRLKALQRYQEQTGIDVIYKDEYPLKKFLNGALRTDPRCDFCYDWRLDESAKKASELEFDSFTTTLMLSPYQDHDLLKKIGGEKGEENDVKFTYADLTDGFRESHEKADDMDLYKQGYCGCIFSESERYKKRLLKDE